jgi:hypothetical protein
VSDRHASMPQRNRDAEETLQRRESGIFGFRGFRDGSGEEVTIDKWKVESIFLSPPIYRGTRPREPTARTYFNLPANESGHRPIIGPRDFCFTLPKTLSETVGNPQDIGNSASLFFVFLRFSSFFFFFCSFCARMRTRQHENDCILTTNTPIPTTFATFSPFRLIPNCDWRLISAGCIISTA